MRLRAQGRHGVRVPFAADISVAASDIVPGHRIVLLRELDKRRRETTPIDRRQSAGAGSDPPQRRRPGH